MSALAEADLEGEAVSRDTKEEVGKTCAPAGAAGAAGEASKAETAGEEGCTLVAKWQGKTIELPELAKSTTIGEIKVGGYLVSPGSGVGGEGPCRGKEGASLDAKSVFWPRRRNPPQHVDVHTNVSLATRCVCR